MLFLKKELCCMPGVFFSRDTNFILTLSPHYFEKHILEVMVCKKI
jgi:hypothetical protein